MRVTFLVTTPDNTPKSAQIFATGNHKKLSKWSPKGVALQKVGKNQYQKSFLFKKGAVLNFKFTRGNWDTVEKDEKFHEYPNRLLRVKKGQVVHYKVENWADMGKPEIKDHTWSGIIKEHKNFKATKLKNSRKIWVYLPPSYPASKRKRYPVLYVHDGNNVFDEATAFLGVEWELDETAEKLIKEEKIREIIIVAIENNYQRQEEYTHIHDPMCGGGGDADLYAHFIIKDLKPFIDKEYRTLKDRQYTGIMGSSLGGLVSMYIGWKYWETFSMAGVVSPSVWWAGRDILKVIQKTAKKPPIRVWVDMGSLEGTMDETEEGLPQAVVDARLLRDILIGKGFKLHRDLEYLEVEGAQHTEADWAKRVDKILLFFFGRPSNLSFIRKIFRI